MGTPAAKVTDATTMGTTIIGPGDATVLIGGMPAVVAGDTTTPMPATGAPGTFAMGSTTVLVGGKPVIRVGDVDSNGATDAVGEATVLIG